MKVSLYKLPIYIGLSIYILGLQASRINYEISSTVVRLIQAFGVILVLVSYCIIKKKVKNRAIRIFIVSLPIVFIAALPSRLTDILYLVIILFSIQDMMSKEVYKNITIVTAISTITVLLLCLFKILPNSVVLSYGRIRQTLGFISYTILPFQFLALVFAYTYFRKKLLFVELIFIETIGYLIYKATDVNTFFGVLSVYLVVVYVAKKRPKKNLGKYKVLQACPIIMVIISYITIWLYSSGNSFMANLNLILGGRFLFAERAIERFGISLFGSQIDWGVVNESSYLIIDNAYVNILISYGIFGLAFLLLLYTYLIKYSLKNNDQILLLIVLVNLLFGLLWARLLVFTETEFVVFASSYFVSKDITKTGQGN